MTILAAVIAQQASASSSSTPLDYEPDLRMFLDAENGITLSGDDVTSWEEQDTNNSFTVPGGGRSPEFESNIQNGLPGVNFQQPIGETFLNRKLAASASFVDNHFGTGSGQKTIAFAAKLNRLTDSVFGTSNTIAEKGYRLSGGWRLVIAPDGTIRFDQRRSNGSTWSIAVNGFYSVGSLVLGYLSYNGGNSTGSGFFRLYDAGSDSFITAGSVTKGTASGIGTDTFDQMVIGNTRDPDNADTNQPFQGPIFGLWMTRPAATVFDENYLRRWIP